MNFGFRLPGPFRVGISSKGRVNVGVTLGPVSVSTDGGGRRRGPQSITSPHSLEEALAELLADGWTATGSDGRGTVLVTKGWSALSLHAIPGGVEARRVTSRRTMIAWTVVVVAVLALCVAVAG